MNESFLYPGPWLRVLAAVGGCALVSAPPAEAARSVRATVDAKGNLRFSKATLKALGVSTRDGMVAVELPLPPRPVKQPPAPAGIRPAPVKPGTPHVHGPECSHLAYEGPPRLYVSLRPDGSLEIRKQKLPPFKTPVPGAPGTAFLASAEKGRLILAKPK